MHIVIVWAWGSWISNLAHIIWDLWYKNLVAIDAQESQITTALKEKWIPVKIGHWKYDIKDDDIVIYSAYSERFGLRSISIPCHLT